MVDTEAALKAGRGNSGRVRKEGSPGSWAAGIGEEFAGEALWWPDDDTQQVDLDGDRSREGIAMAQPPDFAELARELAATCASHLLGPPVAAVKETARRPNHGLFFHSVLDRLQQGPSDFEATLRLALFPKQEPEAPR